MLGSGIKWEVAGTVSEGPAWEWGIKEADLKAESHKSVGVESPGKGHSEV